MEIKTKSLQDFLNASFLGKIKIDNYTDIVFNGVNLYGESLHSQKELLIAGLNNQEVADFLNHLANLLGKNFNTMNPILDIAFLTYRLSAVHPCIARSQGKGLYNFSLRIFKPRVVIPRSETEYMPKVVIELFEKLISHKQSILISGLTGSGKTELQKFLVGFMAESTRVIIIEDIYESFLRELYPELDIQCWVTFNNQEKLKEEMNKLIKTALRNNPEWLIISEVRGSEAKEMYTSLTTGHPLITTIHSISAFKSIERFLNLIEESNPCDLVDYLRIAVHCEKQRIGAKTIRLITQIVEYQKIDEQIVKVPLYEFKNSKRYYQPLSQELAQKINWKEVWYDE